MTSIVIPAHNEERVLGRLLSALLADAAPTELDVVVVANGCTDTTAEVAAGFGQVRVVETPVPSKSGALGLGDAAARGYPRLYVDADVVLRTADVRALCRALSTLGVLAAGPVRRLPMDGVRWPVRWYYDVWQRLPAVRDELFGRGAIALSEDGHARLGDWGDVMSDDLAVAMSFGPDQRVIAQDAIVEIRPPRTYADLLRRRVRAMTGNSQLVTGPRPAGVRPPPRTGGRELFRLAAADPRLAPKVALFLATAVVARLRARRANPDTWLRDESSRTP
ncbi:glycosyltransferase [Jiangella asiatica]|uniref:4,4'-diaponeurosporenoate glycosyltransferase n=1 Tax=Jiangella asiatica TaxID=2530372 RepID=A0A4V2YZY6_9ACTN|nr:glycosyltransferase family 2 protein [Jiangella asiatica]TDD98947.1 glycosyltransferase [Jiangella asiatica]